MRSFAETPIRSKLIRLVVSTSGIVLLFALLILIIVETISIRHSMKRAVGTLAQAVAFNSTAALAFDDPEDAAQVLTALQADPSVNYAALFDADGNLFATFPRDAGGEKVPVEVRRQGQAFSGGYFHHYQPVTDQDTRWGTLYIRSELILLRNRLFLDLGIGIFILAGAIIASYIIASIIQRSISAPILALAEVAREVSEKHDFDLRADKLTDDEVGELSGAFNEMLTELGNKEAALRRSEERLRLALQGSRTGVWEVQLPEGRMEVEGHVFSVLRGFRSGGTLQELIELSIHPDDHAAVEEAMKRAVERGGHLEVTFRALLEDGSIRHYHTRGMLQKNAAGEPVHMLGVTIDVTAVREAQEEIVRLNRELEQRVQARTAQLRDAVREIESFSYSVSHDLRAPLRSIDGFSKILLAEYEGQLEEEGRDLLRRIRGSSQRMAQLIEDLLRLSRVTRQEMSRTPVDLSELVTEIAHEMRQTNRGRTVQVTVEPDMQAFADKNLLRIVYENLLSNAWKFTSKVPDPRVEIGSRNEQEEKVYFVRDNGAGFRMENAEKLFGAFQRLHGTSEFEGTGIGLATVKRIIDRHGGRIWADAAPQAGATFYFTIPPLSGDGASDNPFATAG